MVAFATLYNYLADETRVIEDTAVTMERSGIYIRSIEEYNNYLKYVAGSIPIYTSEEIKNMIHYYNEDLDSKLFAKMSESPLEDVVARHTDIAK